MATTREFRLTDRHSGVYNSQTVCWVIMEVLTFAGSLHTSGGGPNQILSRDIFLNRYNFLGRPARNYVPLNRSAPEFNTKTEIIEERQIILTMISHRTNCLVFGWWAFGAKVWFIFQLLTHKCTPTNTFCMCPWKTCHLIIAAYPWVVLTYSSGIEFTLADKANFSRMWLWFFISWLQKFRQVFWWLSFTCGRGHIWVDI